MLPLIYTDSVPAAIFLAVCLIWLVPEVIGTRTRTASRSRKEATIQDRGSMVVLIGLQWLGLALSFWLAKRFPEAAIPWHRTLLCGIGGMLIFLGVALRWYAIWTLGRYFTCDVAVSADQLVVQRGPYRWIRHPAYSGTFVTLLGVGLTLTNWASLVALIACVLTGYLYRVRVEERALVQSIGQPYAEYMRRTKRFIPRVF